MQLIAVVERRGRHDCPSNTLLPKLSQFLMTYDESFVCGEGVWYPQHFLMRLWMRVAMDSMRCRRRIEQTELIFAPVLSENIYDIVAGPLMNIVVIGFFNNRQLNVPSVGSVDVIACVSVFFTEKTLVCLVF